MVGAQLIFEQMKHLINMKIQGSLLDRQVETMDVSLVKLSVWSYDEASDLGTWLATELPVLTDVRINSICINSWFCYTIDLTGIAF